MLSNKVTTAQYFYYKIVSFTVYIPIADSYNSHMQTLQHKISHFLDESDANLGDLWILLAGDGNRSVEVVVLFQLACHIVIVHDTAHQFDVPLFDKLLLDRQAANLCLEELLQPLLYLTAFFRVHSLEQLLKDAVDEASVKGKVRELRGQHLQSLLRVDLQSLSSQSAKVRRTQAERRQSLVQNVPVDLPLLTEILNPTQVVVQLLFFRAGNLGRFEILEHQTLYLTVCFALDLLILTF